MPSVGEAWRRIFASVFAVAGFLPIHFVVSGASRLSQTVGGDAEAGDFPHGALAAHQPFSLLQRAECGEKWRELRDDLQEKLDKEVEREKLHVQDMELKLEEMGQPRVDELNPSIQAEKLNATSSTPSIDLLDLQARIDFEKQRWKDYGFVQDPSEPISWPGRDDVLHCERLLAAGSEGQQWLYSSQVHRVVVQTFEGHLRQDMMAETLDQKCKKVFQLHSADRQRLGHRVDVSCRLLRDEHPHRPRFAGRLRVQLDKDAKHKGSVVFIRQLLQSIHSFHHDLQLANVLRYSIVDWSSLPFVSLEGRQSVEHLRSNDLFSAGLVFVEMHGTSSFRQVFDKMMVGASVEVKDDRPKQWKDDQNKQWLINVWALIRYIFKQACATNKSHDISEAQGSRRELAQALMVFDEDRQPSLYRHSDEGLQSILQSVLDSDTAQAVEPTSEQTCSKKVLYLSYCKPELAGKYMEEKLQFDKQKKLKCTWKVMMISAEGIAADSSNCQLKGNTTCCIF